MRSTGETEEAVYEAVTAGWLEIREDGSVWRIAQRRKSRWDGQVRVNPVTPHRVDAQIKDGYRTVKIMVDGVQVSTVAHRLVWRHFRGSIPPGLTVNHKNGKKGENHPGNLELATYSEQMIHATHVLGVSRAANQSGESNVMAKLTDEQVAEIRRRRASGETLAQIAASYGVAFQTISKIARGDRRA